MFKFLVDENLLGLARLLRMMGADAETRTGASDSELLYQAQKERRILLTQDRRLYRSVSSGNGHLVLAESPKVQLMEVLTLFPINKDTSLTRCLECNGHLRRTPKERLRGKIEEKTYQLYEVFYECSSCHRIYWEGSHYHKLRREVKMIQDILWP